MNKGEEELLSANAAWEAAQAKVERIRQQLDEAVNEAMEQQLKVRSAARKVRLARSDYINE